LLAVARGEAPADLALVGGRVADVLTGEIRAASVAVCGERVAALGTACRALETIDLDGATVLPGLIDAHAHLESAMVSPREFSRLLVPRGVTTAVIDPHEIANVLGVAGVKAMLAASIGIPLDLFVMAPSCVPATNFSTSGGALEAAELAELLREPGVLGIGEMMNYPGVAAGVPEVLSKIDTAGGRPVDGHAPGLSGPLLNAYVAAGITSDHECTGVAEALEKLRLGMWIYLREGSSARNLAALMPLITPTLERRLCLCTDDRDLEDLLGEGSIDHALRMVLAGPVDPVTGVRLATLNPAERFGLADRGAVAPGRLADLVVVDDPTHPVARLVFKNGRLVARDGKLLDAGRRHDFPHAAASVRIDRGSLSFAVAARGLEIRVIGARPGQIVTAHLVRRAAIREGLAVADPGRDLAKVAVVERHTASGRVGLGFVEGLGLRHGAIAQTVAHDHHNLIVAGVDDASMTAAALAVADAGGGMAAALGGEVVASLPLPVAGLMSDLPFEEVLSQRRALLAAARGLGCLEHDPFMLLSFLGLEVIPALKITDRGLVDVERFELVPLFVEDGRAGG
jgi:adenine deaminase